MNTKQQLNTAAILAALTLAACSSDSPSTDTSMLNPEAPVAENTGEPGGDITPIAGLWDGTTSVGDTNDVVYWNLAADGVLTRYDYQQDGMPTATGENCYIVGQAITVTPEGVEDHSIFDVAVSAARNGDNLTITFNEADKNDLNQNDDIEETPVFTWTILTTPTLAELNACVTATEASSDLAADDSQASNSISEEGPAPTPDTVPEPAGDIPGMPSNAPTGSEAVALDSPPMTRAECGINAGTVVGDIGNGAIFTAEYRCESGQAPIARITYLDGEPIAADGEVCCV